MNLMDNKNENNLIVTNEILHMLSDIGTENLKIAKQFFDFSQEMDLSLLEGLTFHHLKQSDYTKTSADWVEKHQKEPHNKYLVRYILFLDALGQNTACFMFNYLRMNRMLDSEYKQLKDNLIYAFSLKYSDEDTKAKYAALLATDAVASTFAFKILGFACTQPFICLKAAKEFCHEVCTDTKALLYAAALHHLEPITEITDDNRILAEEMLEAIKYLHKYVMKSNSPIELDKIMIYCFMTYHHDISLKNPILNQTRSTLKEFIRNVWTKISPDYLEKNMDDLLDILNFQKDKDFIVDCLQFVLKEFGGEYRLLQKLLNNTSLFLTATAKKYPKEYIQVMLSTEIVNRNSTFTNYYPMMYKILEEANPDAIETYHLNFDKDVLKLTINLEVSTAKAHKDLVDKVLCGEIEAKCLKPYRDDFNTNNQIIKNDKLLKVCFEIYPDFKKRYLALKVYQSYYQAWQLFNNFFESNAEFIDALVSEHLSVEDRFLCYEAMFDFAWDNEIKNNLKKSIVQKMIELHDTNHKEYSVFCPNGIVMTRLIYVAYLDATNQNGANKNLLLEMLKDTSKDVRRAATETMSKHKEYEPDVLELLKSKKASVREAGVDILIIWGVDNYKDILEEMSQKEKNAKLLDKINSAFDCENSGSSISSLSLVETLLRNGRKQKVAWLYNNKLNDDVHLTNGNLAGTDYMQALLVCYAGMETLGLSANAALLAKDLNTDELNRFAGDVFSAWLDDGAVAKKKWVLYFCAIHGDHVMVEDILHYIKEWAENSRGAIAAEAVKALALNGSSEALMSIDNLAHKSKFKQVKTAAVEALENAAKALDMTTDELGDRIVPNLGFDENRECIFDYGTRQFKVYLSSTLELEVYDENNKKLKNLPAPAKKDTLEIAKKSNDNFKLMKKQLKNTITMQKMRLETALLADRRWTVEAWTALFVKNPIMHSFAIGLVWAAYENDTLLQTFRYMEDGTFNTVDEDEYTLPENCIIGLIHPIDLDEDTLTAWKEQLSDYEIVQPVEQLNRPIYRIKEDEIGTFDVLRYVGKQIKSIKLLSHLTKLGWYKGSVQDAGMFYSFYREDITKRIKENDTVTLFGNAVELKFSGMYVAAYGFDENEDVEIESIRFYKVGSVERGSYVYDEPDDARSFKLETVSPRYFSEILAQIELLFKNTDDK